MLYSGEQLGSMQDNLVMILVYALACQARLCNTASWWQKMWCFGLKSNLAYTCTQHSCYQHLDLVVTSYIHQPIRSEHMLLGQQRSGDEMVIIDRVYSPLNSIELHSKIGPTHHTYLASYSLYPVRRGRHVYHCLCF